MKGISAYIATMILVAISLSIGYIIYIWISNIANKTTKEQSSYIEKELLCKNAGIRIESVDFCSSNLINFTVRNVGKSDLSGFFVNLKFKDGRIANYKDIKECYYENILKLVSGEKKCAYVFDNINNLSNVVELEIVSSECPEVYDSIAVNC
ncbi:MAG: hypothetical protein QW409_03220 [Candidatus Aenigmatarchaeota archaeon]